VKNFSIRLYRNDLRVLTLAGRDAALLASSDVVISGISPFARVFRETRSKSVFQPGSPGRAWRNHMKRAFYSPCFQRHSAIKTRQRRGQCQQFQPEQGGGCTCTPLFDVPKRIALCCHRKRKSITCKLKANGNESRFSAFRTSDRC